MDRSGSVYHFTALTPVLAGAEAELRALVQSLPTGTASPFASIPGTHFGRWVVLEQLGSSRPGERAEPLRPARLLFSVIIDVDPDAYLRSMCVGIPKVVDSVWRHCSGYPGIDDHDAFSGYVRRYQLDHTYCLATSPEGTVDDVRRSLDRRRRLIDFAVRSPGGRGAALRRSFEETFRR